MSNEDTTKVVSQSINQLLDLPSLTADERERLNAIAQKKTYTSDEHNYVIALINIYLNARSNGSTNPAHVPGPAGQRISAASSGAAVAGGVHSARLPGGKVAAKLGRIKSIDLRDHNFLMRDALQQPDKLVTAGHKQWSEPPVMDQGNTPQCVAYSGTAWLRAGPVINKPTPTHEYPWGTDPVGLYKLCQRNDDTPGENYDGTTVRALFKVLQMKKFVSSYVWAFSVEPVTSWLLNRGPVVVGTNWYETMWEPEAGFLQLHPERNPAVVGGHAWLLIGVDTEKKCPDGSTGAIRMQNSWGRSWGENGRAWISLRDIEILIKSDGEAATAVEVKPAL